MAKLQLQIHTNAVGNGVKALKRDLKDLARAAAKNMHARLRVTTNDSAIDKLIKSVKWIERNSNIRLRLHIDDTQLRQIISKLQALSSNQRVKINLQLNNLQYIQRQINGLGQNQTVRVNVQANGLDDVESKISSLSGVIGGVATGASGGGLLKIGANYEDLFKSIQNQTNATASEMQSLQDVSVNMINSGLFGLGSDAFDGVGTAIIRLRQQVSGLNAKELESAAYGINELATLYDADLSEMTRAVAKHSKQYNQDISKSIDQLLRYKQLGGATDGDTDPLIEFSEAFKKMGYSADEALDAMLVFERNGGMRADLIANAVNEASLSFAEMPDSLRVALADLGLSYKDLQKMALSGAEGTGKSLQKVAKQILAVKDDAKRNALAVEIFKTPFEDGGNPLLQALASTSTAVADSTATMQDAVNNRSASLSVAFKSLLNNAMSAIEPIARHAGEILIPILDNVSAVVGQIGKWFGGLSDETKDFIVIFGGIGVVLTTLVPLITLGATAFSAISAAAAAGGVAIGAISAPVLLIIALIGTLIGTLIYTAKNWDNISRGAQKTWAIVTNVTATSVQAVINWFDGLGTSIADTAKNVWGGVQSIATNIGDGLRYAYDTVVGWGNKMIDGVQQIVANITKYFSFDNLSDGLTNQINKLTAKLPRKLQAKLGLDTKKENRQSKQDKEIASMRKQVINNNVNVRDYKFGGSYNTLNQTIRGL